MNTIIKQHIGIDMVNAPRFKQLLHRYKSRFSDNIFTQVEWELYNKFPLRLAARFAAKEAVAKALGLGLAHMYALGIPATDIEILNSLSGEPYVNLYNAALHRMAELKLITMQVSLSHDSHFAVAIAIGNKQ